MLCVDEAERRVMFDHGRFAWISAEQPQANDRRQASRHGLQLWLPPHFSRTPASKHSPSAQLTLARYPCCTLLYDERASSVVIKDKDVYAGGSPHLCDHHDRLYGSPGCVFPGNDVDEERLVTKVQPVSD
jgi:hypothetical protein